MISIIMTQHSIVSAKHTLVMIINYCHQSSKPILGAYMLSNSPFLVIDDNPEYEDRNLRFSNMLGSHKQLQKEQRSKDCLCAPNQHGVLIR
jgi:predicted secreted protein